MSAMLAPTRRAPLTRPGAADYELVVGRQVQPTRPAPCTLHPARCGLRRPGRLLVVDEAFMDTVPGESESLTKDAGVLVVRRSPRRGAGRPGDRVRPR